MLISDLSILELDIIIVATYNHTLNKRENRSRNKKIIEPPSKVAFYLAIKKVKNDCTIKWHWTLR